MASYGNYYGNLGAKFTGFTDETPDVQPLPLGSVSQAPSKGASYSGMISTGQPRVNSFSNNSGGMGGVGRDVLAKQKGTRAAQEQYEALKAQEGVTNRTIANPENVAKNAQAARFNSLASLVDQYNSQLSSSLYGAQFGDPTTYGYKTNADGSIPLSQGFAPRNMPDYDGVNDQTRADLLAAIQGLTPEELQAASPEFRIWAQQFQKFGVSEDPGDYGSAGLSKYLNDLAQAGVVNPAYVNRFGSEYSGSAVVDPSVKVGSQYSWGDIDNDLTSGFLPNAGLNAPDSAVYGGASVFPIIPTISSKAMFNPFTNSPIETSKTGSEFVQTDRTQDNAFTTGYQWGQGAFSTPFAPYYTSGYGDRFKDAPSGSGVKQWNGRDLTGELRQYLPTEAIETTTKGVAGQLQDPIEQKLAIGQRELFSRDNQLPTPQLVSTTVQYPGEVQQNLPSLLGERTVDLGAVGSGLGSYRLEAYNPGQVPSGTGTNYFGVYDQGSGVAWNASPVVGSKDPTYQYYLQSVSDPRATGYGVYDLNNQQVGQIGDLRYLYESRR